MEKKKIQYNVVVLIGIICLLLFISTLFYINLDKQKAIEVEANVKLVGNDYIVVEDMDGDEYSLKTDKEYNIGDRVSFVIKNIDKNSYPKEGDLLNINIISRNVTFYINDTIEDIDSEEIETVIDNTSEDDVILFFTKLNNNLDSYSNDKNIGDELKSGFVKVVDFLFYDGEINGKTFDELSIKAKLKVLQTAFFIDNKIDKYFPGYKEIISNTSKNIYTNVKKKILEKYLELTTQVCENDADTCEFAKEGLTNLKESFSLTWNYIKEISGVGISKLKAWYEIWKSC